MLWKNVVTDFHEIFEIGWTWCKEQLEVFYVCIPIFSGMFGGGGMLTICCELYENLINGFSWFFKMSWTWYKEQLVEL